MTHANESETDDSDTDNSETGEKNENSFADWDINTIKDSTGKLVEQFQHQNGKHNWLTGEKHDREDQGADKATVAGNAVVAVPEATVNKGLAELKLVGFVSSTMKEKWQ